MGFIIRIILTVIFAVLTGIAILYMAWLGIHYGAGTPATFLGICIFLLMVLSVKF